jgi:hypothetical protein
LEKQTDDTNIEIIPSQTLKKIDRKSCVGIQEKVLWSPAWQERWPDDGDHVRRTMRAAVSLQQKPPHDRFKKNFTVDLLWVESGKQRYTSGEKSIQRVFRWPRLWSEKLFIVVESLLQDSVSQCSR